MRGAPGHTLRSRDARPGAKILATGLVGAVMTAMPMNDARSSGVTAQATPWRLSSPVYRTVAVASGGRIYVLGGHDSAGGSVSSVIRFDPGTGNSAVAGSLALPTHGAAAAVLEGKILVFGGASLQVHDTVQEFDPATGKTKVVGYMPVVRADTTAASVDKEVVLIGGFDGDGPQGDVWATTDGTRFRVVAHLAQPVRYPAVAVQRNDVYVFGGLISGGEYNGLFTSDIQEVAPSSGTARVVGHLPQPLAHAMGASIGGRLFVIGGSTPTGPSRQVLRFDLAKASVSLVTRLPQPLTDAAVATIGTTAYLLGGMSTSGPLDTVMFVRA